MITYLVTGGCGFIGSHLCDALLGNGNSVRVLDDLSTGSLANLPKGAEFIRADVADLAAVEGAMASVDGCFHLAAATSVDLSTREWLGTHRTNLTGTITVFEAARRHRRIPVVYASSAAVYGDNEAVPLSETADKTPLSAYGADKLGCEMHARIAARLHGVPTVGLRFFNVYGPRQDPKSPYSGVISIFCNNLRRGNAVDIFGSGSQTRDFIYVDDVVRALLRAMDRNELSPAVFNVCTGTPTSVMDLVALIGGLCGKEPSTRFKPPRPGDIVQSFGDPGFARQHLGFAAGTALRSGLTATIEWLGTHDGDSP